MNPDGTTSPAPLKSPRVDWRDDGGGFIYWQDGGRTEFSPPPRTHYGAPVSTRFLVATLVAALAALGLVVYLIHNA